MYFEYGNDATYGSTTAPVVLSSTGSYSDVVSAPSSHNELFYRAVVTIGPTTVYGAGSSVPIPSGIGGLILRSLLRVVLAAAIVAGVIRFSGGSPIGLLMTSTIGVIGFVIVDTMLINLI